MRIARRLAIASAVLLASACGRTSLLGFDNGCPPDDPNCIRPDGGAGDGGTGDGGNSGDGGRRDGGFGDGGNRDGAIVDGGRDGGRRDGGFTDGGGDGGNRDGGFGDGGRRDGGFGDGGFFGDGGRRDGGFGVDLSVGGDGGFLVDGATPDAPGCNNLQIDCTLKENQGSAACVDKKKEDCYDRVDNDGNGLVDCADPQCFGWNGCYQLGTEICNNGIDDNLDGLVDCADPGCVTSSVCMPHMGSEICNDNKDDNGDGLADCADPQCVGFAACLEAACTPDYDFGALAPTNSRSTVGMTSADSCTSYASCATPGGTGRVARVVLTGSGPTDLRLDALQAPGVANVLDLYRAGVDQACDANKVFCVALGEQRSITYTFAALPPGTYWLVLESYPGTQGSVTVTLSTAGAPTADLSVGPRDGGTGTLDLSMGGGSDGGKTIDLSMGGGSDGGGGTIDLSMGGGSDGGVVVNDMTAVSPDALGCKTTETCNNGVDDNCNGLTDCQDSQCFNDVNCAGKECKPDFNVGTLVPNGPYKEVTFDTASYSNRWHPTCAGTSTGDDVVVEFTLPEPAGILVQWTQTGDHVFGLFQMPNPGQGCDADQLSCYYPGGSGSGTVAWQLKPQGTYVFILKSINGSSEGVMDLKISAFTGKMVEICSNGIDDDLNGLTDCQDPVCWGVDGCIPPLCIPDQDLGNIDFGTVVNTTVNNIGGEKYWKTKCATGTGGERVIRVNLLHDMALGFSCQETGDSVLQLDAQVQPLDECDQDLLVCADPQVLPFGCNYAVPNLKAGEYNIIVQAFQSGTEGVTDLTLYGIEEKVLEICNNGIDDDMDGFTDCYDIKCATSPYCALNACKATQSLGTLPYDGTITSAVVQTSNSADNNTLTPCVTMPGGKDAVVDFTTPATGNLTIEWAQAGNHVFALYQDTNDQLACEANPIVDCHPSNGALTGSYTLNMLPSMKYHLVVDATAPGSEGGVVLQLSGMP